MDYTKATQQQMLLERALYVIHALKYYHRAQLNMRNHPNGTDYFFNGTEK